MTIDCDFCRYHGPIKAVITDLAGTTVDFGSCAPAGSFVELFQNEGIDVSVEQAREPMGMHKRDHIRTMLDMPAIVTQWIRVKGRPWTPEDLERMFGAFIPMQLACLPKFNQVIPGVVDTVAGLRKRGICVGANTGYNNEMLEIVLASAAQQGFAPDAALCAADVPAGRPAPWMIYRLMEALEVYPPAAVVKIGDTIADVQAGVNAGVWSVGVTRTGNMIGLSESDLAGLSPEELERRTSHAADRLIQAGAHYVIDGFADLPEVIGQIEDRMREGIGV